MKQGVPQLIAGRAIITADRASAAAAAATTTTISAASPTNGGPASGNRTTGHSGGRENQRDAAADGKVASTPPRIQQRAGDNLGDADS